MKVTSITVCDDSLWGRVCVCGTRDDSDHRLPSDRFHNRRHVYLHRSLRRIRADRHAHHHRQHHHHQRCSYLDNFFPDNRQQQDGINQIILEISQSPTISMVTPPLVLPPANNSSRWKSFQGWPCLVLCVLMLAASVGTRIHHHHHHRHQYSVRCNHDHHPIFSASCRIYSSPLVARVCTQTTSLPSSTSTPSTGN